MTKGHFLRQLLWEAVAKVIGKVRNMKRIGKFIAKRKISIVLIAFLLLIPSALGFAATKVNYDILSYLPDSLETVAGQDIMVEEFGMGAFSMVVVDGMEKKDVVALEEKIE